MHIEDKRLGKIVILGSENEDENNKEEQKNYASKLKITFDNERETVYLYQSEKDQEMFSLLKEQAVYYCLYLKMERKSRAYYYDEKSNIVFLIDKLDTPEFIVSINKPSTENNISVSDIVDEHFGGSSVFEITEDYNFIKKEYASDKKLFVIAFFAIGIILVLWIFYTLLFDEEKPPPPPPPPPPKPLSSFEQNNIKNLVSIELVKWLENNAKDSFASRTEGEGRKRLVVFSQDKYTSLSPIVATRRSDGSYYYPDSKYKRGAIDVSFNLVYQESFPGVGFEMAKDKIYEKNSLLKKKYGIEDVNLSKNYTLTEECLRKSLLFSQSKTYVSKRDKKQIVIKFLKQPPLSFLRVGKDILNKCPAYFENITLSQAFFNGDLVLYKNSGDKNE